MGGTMCSVAHRTCPPPRNAPQYGKRKIYIKKKRYSSDLMYWHTFFQESSAMEQFIQKHHDKITGVISVFDRIIFKGYLTPITYPQGLQLFLNCNRVLLKDFKEFVKKQSLIIKAHAEKYARLYNRPFEFKNANIDKEEYARSIAKRDKITEGLICVLSVVEHNPSFEMRTGNHRLHLVKCKPQCTTLYFYFMDTKLGFMHVRIATYLPYTIQIYVNGHEWLAKQMHKKGIKFTKVDNAFSVIDDPVRAQQIADKFSNLKWVRMLNHFAHRVNPLLCSLLRFRYYWAVEQAEFSTDIMFSSAEALHQLDESLQRNVPVCLTAENILMFFGKQRPGACKDEVRTYYYKRSCGACVKHTVNGNWIKMYDKHGSILRIETVIYNPYAFSVRRRCTRNGKHTVKWLPLCKRISFLFRYAQISLSANSQYLNAISVIDDPAQAYKLLDTVCEPRVFHKRQRRPLNPLRRSEVELFCAVMRGEHSIHGFTNRQLALKLGICCGTSQKEKKRSSAKVSRLIQLLRAHKLIAKIPHSRRYRITLNGLRMMSAAIHLRKDTFPNNLYRKAA